MGLRSCSGERKIKVKLTLHDKIVLVKWPYYEGIIEKKNLKDLLTCSGHGLSFLSPPTELVDTVLPVDGV